MSTKLAADESNVENVSIKTRPMNVAEEYQLLCSNQWLQAKTVLDEVGGSRTPDYIKIQLLSEVLMVSFRIALILTNFVLNFVSSYQRKTCHNVLICVLIPKNVYSHRL